MNDDIWESCWLNQLQKSKSKFQNCNVYTTQMKISLFLQQAEYQESQIFIFNEP